MLPLIVLASLSSVSAYEWRSHNRMATRARDIFLGGDRPAFPVDRQKELQDFLDRYGPDLDTRAGNPCDPNADPTCLGLDEDNQEGKLVEVFGCVYSEGSCLFACTKDHFSPPLPFPLAGIDATAHAADHFEMAVKLYKAAVCAKEDGKPDESEKLFRWSARALGHCLHLVQDMGSPQHVKPELHIPFFSHGPSFHENWSLQLWLRALPESPFVGGFEVAAGSALDPARGRLDGIMGSLAAGAKQFPTASPFAPGVELAVEDLLRVVEKSAPTTRWDAYGLQGFEVDQYPGYSRGHVPPGRHGYSSGWIDPDFLRSEWGAPDNGGSIVVRSFDLAERLWAEDDAEHSGRPQEYDAALKSLITKTTEGSAGAILAFWDEVKDYQCQCEDSSPCSEGAEGSSARRARAESRAAARGEKCPTPPAKPLPPDNDYPDENHGVVEGAVSISPLENVGAISARNTISLGAHWQEITRIGIGKGLTSLADFGRTMTLLAASDSLATADEATQDVAFNEMRLLEAKYSAPRTRPEDELNRGAHVALFGVGFAEEAGKLLDVLHQPYVEVGVNFDPLQLAEENEVLLVPSGGLQGMADDARLKERFTAYVAAGGTLIALGQARGDDFQVLPATSELYPQAYGWTQDQSCWREAAVPAARHPALASAQADVLSMGVDGYFEISPDGAEVLMRKRTTGWPMMIAERVGQGRVVMTTMYEDWAQSHGQGSPAGLAIMADLLSWGAAKGSVDAPLRLGDAGDTSATVRVANVTETATDTVEWQLRDPLRKTLVASWREPLALPPGESRSVTATSPVRPESPGLYHLDYRLLDSSRPVSITGGDADAFQVQPVGEAGEIGFEAWPDRVRELPLLAVALTLESEWTTNGGVIPAHVAISNRGDAAFSGTLRLQQRRWRGEPWSPAGLEQPVELGPAATVDLAVQLGPLSLGAGHDGRAGGAILQAALYTESEREPIVTATKGVLNDTELVRTALEASVASAVLDDVVEFDGAVLNRSHGSLVGKHRITIMATTDATTWQPYEDGGEWTQFELEREESLAAQRTVAVEPRWQGAMYGRLEVCLYGEPCWAGQGKARHISTARVGLPKADARVQILQPAVVPGPGFRVPVLVRNAGLQPLKEAQVSVRVGPQTRQSGTFDLVVGGEHAVEVDVPFDPAQGVEGFPVEAKVFARNFVRFPPTAVSLFSYSAAVRSTGLVVARAGAIAAGGSLEVVNRASAGLPLTVTLSCPELALSWSTTSLVRPLQIERVPFSVPLGATLPYGEYELQVNLSDGIAINAGESVPLKYLEPGVVVVPSVLTSPVVAGSPVELRVTVNARETAAPVGGTLEVSSDVAGTIAMPVAVFAGEPAVVPLSLDIAADSLPGERAYAVRWVQGNGYERVQLGSFVLGRPRLDIGLASASIAAGESLGLTLVNQGGTRGEFELEVELQRRGRRIVRGARVVGLDPGATEVWEVGTSGGLSSGAYEVVARFRSADATSSGSKRFEVAIAGAEASLDVATDRATYEVAEEKPGRATIVAGARGLDAGTLELEVVAPRPASTDIEPWGSFQGGAARTGASAGGGLLVPNTSADAVPVLPELARLDTGFEWPLSRVAGDLNVDGFDDVVVASWTSTGQHRLTVFHGPDLSAGGSLVVGGSWSDVALALGDIDGDEEPELVEIDTGTGSSLAVRAFSATLAPLWSASLPMITASGTVLEGAGLALADVTGAAGLEVVVSSGADVTVLSGGDGARLWRLTSTASVAGLRLGGLAAADVDGDRRAEMAVAAIRSSTGQASLLMVESDGSLAWTATLPAPVASSPVLAGNGTGGFVVGVVTTPSAPTATSRLVVLNAATGAIVGASTVTFRSSWPPAVGDLGGDGIPELVVASGTAHCEGCFPVGPMAFSLGGEVRWAAAVATDDGGPPLLMDVDGDGLRDVVAGYTTFGEELPGGEISRAAFEILEASAPLAWSGLDGSLIAGAPEQLAGPMLVLDLDGDGSPELLQGWRVLTTCRDCFARWGESSWYPSRSEVLWSWVGPIALTPAATLEIVENLGTGGEEGLFCLRGTLRDRARQVLATDHAFFSVSSGTVRLALETVGVAVDADASFEVHGVVDNAGSGAVAAHVAIAVDGAPIGETDVSAPAAGSASWSVTVPALEAGLHRIDGALTVDGSEAGTATAFVLAELPDVVISPTTSGFAGTDPFQVGVRLENLGHRPLSLAVSLEDVTLLPPSPRRAAPSAPGRAAPLEITLGSREEREVVFERRISSDTSYVARVTGDWNGEAPFDVVFDAVLEAALLADGPSQVGPVSLPVRLANTGSEAWDGEMAWELRGGGSGGGNVATRLEPGEGFETVAAGELAGSGASLSIWAGQQEWSLPIEILESRGGRLAVALPEGAVEGLVSIAVEVSSSRLTESSFVVELTCRRADDGGIAATATEGIRVPAGGTSVSSLDLFLPAGEYVLLAALDGVSATAPEDRFEVAVREGVRLMAANRGFDDDGLLRLAFHVENLGAWQFAGEAIVAGPFGELGVPLEIEPGGATDRELLVDPAWLPIGPCMLGAAVRNGAGDELAATEVVVEVTAGSLTVSHAPSVVAARAGGLATVSMDVANGGVLPVDGELRFELADGAMGIGVDTFTVVGGGAGRRSMSIPLSADLASAPIFGRWEVSRRGDADSWWRVATGPMRVDVAGLPIEVEPTLDTNRADAGGSVHLDLAVHAEVLTETIGLVATVSYGPHEERREFALSPAGAELEFTVPIAAPGGELGIVIAWPSGRTAYVNALAIHPATGAVAVIPDREEYRPGERVSLAIELPATGSFELVAFDQLLALNASGALSFDVPAEAVQGRVALPWSYVGGGMPIRNGQLVLEVRGPQVKLLNLRAPVGVVAPGSGITVEATVLTDTAMELLVRGWLRRPSGADALLASMPLAVEASTPFQLVLPLDLDTDEAGAHGCIVALYSPGGTLLTTAAAWVEVGGVRLLGLDTDRSDYPTGDEAVTALADLEGEGAGSLTLFLDGNPAGGRRLDGAGVRQAAVPLGVVSPGTHRLEATLLSEDGARSQASAEFRVGGSLPDLAVDLGATTLESGEVRSVAIISNRGGREAPATEIALWDGSPAAGVLLHSGAVPAVGVGSNAVLMSLHQLAQGSHELHAVVDPAGSLREYDEANNEATFALDVAVAPTPSPTPSPGALSIEPVAAWLRPGAAVSVRGRAPDGTYCVVLVTDAEWALGGGQPVDVVARREVVAAGGVIPATEVWVAATVGEYDVLLVEGACGAGGHIVAVAGGGPEPGLVVADMPIPVLSPSGLVLLLVLMLLAGACALAVRRRATWVRES